MTLRDFQSDFNKKLKAKLNNKLSTGLSSFYSICGEVAEDIRERIEESPFAEPISSALAMLRPHFIHLGVRISALNSERIEFKISKKSRLSDSHGRMLAGVLVSSSFEAFRILLLKALETQHLEIKILNSKATFFEQINEDVSVSIDLSDFNREVISSKIIQVGFALESGVARVFSKSGRRVAEIEIDAEIKNLNWIDSGTKKGNVSGANTI